MKKKTAPPKKPARPSPRTILAWRWHERRLKPVAYVQAVQLDDLIDIERQKAALLQNTQQFVLGKPANHVLLTGARGTGKSSIVKALLNHFAPQGLRLVEVAAHDLLDLPDIVAPLREKPERFILYVDDFSVAASDPALTALKTVLDGGIEQPPDNVLIYATSNRRHLMPETLRNISFWRHSVGGHLRCVGCVSRRREVPTPQHQQETPMKIRNLGLALVTVTLFSGAAMAQSNTANDVQRDVNQQQRIEQGLQSGRLTTKEAGKLEREQQHVDKMEARDMKDGSISPAEQKKINAAQNRASQDIAKDKHNGKAGNPESASSERMQADVQRNVNQEKRIERGVKSGQLTTRETGSLERGQARVDGKEANAAADGHVGAREQARIQRSENRQSRRIAHKKHNAKTAG